MPKPLKVLCLVALLLVCNYPFAQKVSIKTGDEFKIKLDGKAEIFGNEKDNFAALVFDGSGTKLCGFNRGLTEIYSNEVDFKSASPFDRHIDVYTLGNKYYWLYSTYEKSDNKCYLFVNEINTKEGKIDLNRKPLLVNDPIAGTSADLYKFFFRANKSYTVATIPNNKYLGMAYIIKPLRDGSEFDHVDIRAHVFEDKFHQTWEKKIRVNTTSNAVLIEDAVLKDNGELYLLLSHKSRNKTESLEVLYFKTDGSEPVSIKPQFNEVAVLEGYKLAAFGSQVAIGGLYYNEDKSNQPDGFYLYTISNNQGKFIRYPDDQSIFKAKGLVNNSRYLEMAEMISLEDGGVFLASEIRLASTSTSSATGNQSTALRYGNVYCARFDGEGKQRWVQKVPKLQLADALKDAIGIRTLEAKNGLVTILNDHESNDDLEEDDKAKAANFNSGKDVTMANVMIDDRGKKTRSTLDLGKMLILPSSFRLVAPGSYIGLAHTKGKSFMPVRVDLK